MLDWLLNIDNEIFLSLNAMRSDFGDTFFLLFSSKWIWVPMYASILYVLFRDFGWKQALLMTVCIALAITIADQLGATVLRPIFERPRPSAQYSPIADMAIYVEGHRPGGHYGFPSCHAANTFALATLLSLWLRKASLLIVFLFIWAVINCYSRIYLAAHYPGDLLCGAVLGAVIGFAVFYLSVRAGRWWLGTGHILRGEPQTASLFYKGCKFQLSWLIIAVGTLTILYICIVSL